MTRVFTHLLSDCRVGYPARVRLATGETKFTHLVQRAIWQVNTASGKCVLSDFITKDGRYVRQNPIVLSVDPTDL